MKCPVCWRTDIRPNKGGHNLAIHADKAGNPGCPGSGQPPHNQEGICRTAD